MTIYMLIDKNRDVLSVNATEEAANEKRDRYNADPFIEPGVPDPAAPYAVEAWEVA